MKKLTMAILLTLPMMANATGETHFNALQPNISTSLVQGQAQVQNNAPSIHTNANGGNSASNSGGNTINVHGDEAKRIPVATASGSFSNTTAECRYLQANSVQFLFFGGSNTSMVRDLVCSLGANLNAEQKLALCLESADYRKIRKQLGNECEIK